ncbi:MAG: hypothetical protein DME55_04485 [Verrucomicrobia bacterium]|nr:MAG: hypothetical protein DME55_04485 [Verrucomicrobiota bacterium]
MDGLVCGEALGPAGILTAEAQRLTSARNASAASAAADPDRYSAVPSVISLVMARTQSLVLSPRACKVFAIAIKILKSAVALPSQGGEIGKRPRLRIAKSSLSKHRSPFQIKKFLRAKHRFLSRISPVLRRTSKNIVVLAQILAHTRQTLPSFARHFSGLCLFCAGVKLRPRTRQR